MKYHYIKPFFSTYIMTAFQILLGLGACIWTFIRERRGGAKGFPWKIINQAIVRETGWTLPGICLRSAPFAILAFGANYLFNIALPHTNLASILSLEQASLICVFILSIFVLGDRPTHLKAYSIVICVGGVLIISFADAGNMGGSNNALLGDTLVIGSSLCTALYMVFYAKYMKGFELKNIFLFLGCVGVTNVILLWPGLLIINYIKFEEFELPQGVLLYFFIGGAFINLVFNLLLNIGIIISSPLFMRVAIICTIPLSFVVDVLIGSEFSWVRLGGAIVIVVGVGVFSYAADKEEKGQVDAACGIISCSPQSPTLQLYDELANSS